MKKNTILIFLVLIILSCEKKNEVTVTENLVSDNKEIVSPILQINQNIDYDLFNLDISAPLTDFQSVCQLPSTSTVVLRNRNAFAFYTDEKNILVVNSDFSSFNLSVESPIPSFTLMNDSYVIVPSEKNTIGLYSLLEGKKINDIKLNATIKYITCSNEYVFFIDTANNASLYNINTNKVVWNNQFSLSIKDAFLLDSRLVIFFESEYKEYLGDNFNTVKDVALGFEYENAVANNYYIVIKSKQSQLHCLFAEKNKQSTMIKIEDASDTTEYNLYGSMVYAVNKSALTNVWDLTSLKKIVTFSASILINTLADHKSIITTDSEVLSIKSISDQNESIADLKLPITMKKNSLFICSNKLFIIGENGRVFCLLPAQVVEVSAGDALLEGFYQPTESALTRMFDSFTKINSDLDKKSLFDFQIYCKDINLLSQLPVHVLKYLPQESKKYEIILTQEKKAHDSLVVFSSNGEEVASNIGDGELENTLSVSLLKDATYFIAIIKDLDTALFQVKRSVQIK